jgi:sodium/potassium-transporting ATPase subunit alpha
VVSGVFSYTQERNAGNAMKKFAHLLPAEAHVRRDGSNKKVPAAHLVVGDVVVVVAGDKVPADIRITKCHEFKVDNSSITGEAEPQVCFASSS